MGSWRLGELCKACLHNSMHGPAHTPQLGTGAGESSTIHSNSSQELARHRWICACLLPGYQVGTPRFPICCSFGGEFSHPQVDITVNFDSFVGGALCCWPGPLCCHDNTDAGLFSYVCGVGTDRGCSRSARQLGCIGCLLCMGHHGSHTICILLFLSS